MKLERTSLKPQQEVKKEQTEEDFGVCCTIKETISHGESTKTCWSHKLKKAVNIYAYIVKTNVTFVLSGGTVKTELRTESSQHVASSDTDSESDAEHSAEVLSHIQ